MIIRNAVEEDVRTLVRLYMNTINSSPLVTTYIKRSIIAKTTFVLTNNDGEILGMYIYSLNRLTNPYEHARSSKIFCWLEQICVWPNLQGIGYGTTLMKHYLEIPTIENRLVCLPDLEEYYKKFGFKRDKTIEHDDRTQLIMTKDNTNEIARNTPRHKLRVS
jgi:N-acetylglutamate synthase-like GNAT family acetyltransferase